MAKTAPLSRKRISKLISEGSLIVIIDQKVLRLDKWAERHPGGKLPILHMVGKDATDQINVYHSEETLKTMSRWQIGTINEPWVDMEPPISAKTDESVSTGDEKSSDSGEPDLSEAAANFTHLSEQKDIERALRDYPSLDPVTQRDVALKFRKLHLKIRKAGLYDCHYSNYMIDLSRYLALFATFGFLFYHGYTLLSAIFLGFFWQQVMFVAHDAGHLAITHDVFTDTIIGVICGDLCCGLSLGWWKSSHNVHHLVPNHPEHDPDIQNVPVLATSPTFFKSVRSSYYNGSLFPWDATAAFFVSIQHYTYYPIMAFARFNLYLLSWQHLIFSLPVLKKENRKLRSTPMSTLWILYLELGSMAIFWYLYINLLLVIPDFPTRVLFVLLSHSISLLLHIQITISHFGMSTADLGPVESFAQKQLRTTMDVDCPAWMDWFHGGLQFQVIHHLFPRLPKHNYRKAQVLVKQFCKETDIKYSIFGFVDGNKVVIGRLRDIAKQVGMLKFCEKHLGEDVFKESFSKASVL